MSVIAFRTTFAMSMIAFERHLAAADDETGLHHGFDRDTRLWVLGEVGVQQRIADLVADFVGVTFGHRLGSEQILAHIGDASYR